MLDDVVAYLRCPHCAGALERSRETLRCAHGHAFDVARQGYVSLLPGDGRGARGDTAAMVDARERFLDAGHFDPLSDALAAAAGPDARCVVDVGAGTGHHLARAIGAGVGIALDSSKYALRRAARAHPRIGAVGCDAWHALPVRDDAADVVLSVFAPRDAAEIARVLAPGGTLVAVTPTPRHLAELVEALGLLAVDEGKPERLDEKLAPSLIPRDRRTVDWELRLDRDACLAAAAMGPTAWHRDDLPGAVAALPDVLVTRAAVTVSRYGTGGA